MTTPTMHPTPERKRITFSIAAIYLHCPCGGECVNRDGSYMIVPTESATATCEQCGATVRIPKGAKR